DRAHLVEPARGGAPCAPAGGGDEIMSVQTISTRSQAVPKMSARTRDRLLNIISPLALLVLWELCTRLGFIDTRFFPAPSSVMSTMIEMLRTGELVTHREHATPALCRDPRRRADARPRHRHGTQTSDQRALRPADRGDVARPQRAH